jgi:acetyl-CoA carboxylase biotin carboxyl carrier protein
LKAIAQPFVAVIPSENAMTAGLLSEQPMDAAGYTIASPLVGLFYRASSPGSPPFVEIGDAVEEGQTVGVVEAMKVFNEITADRSGIVAAIPAQNGDLVQVDQPLVILNPTE